MVKKLLRIGIVFVGVPPELGNGRLWSVESVLVSAMARMRVSRIDSVVDVMPRVIMTAVVIQNALVLVLVMLAVVVTVLAMVVMPMVIMVVVTRSYLTSVTVGNESCGIKAGNIMSDLSIVVAGMRAVRALSCRVEIIDPRLV